MGARVRVSLCRVGVGFGERAVSEKEIRQFVVPLQAETGWASRSGSRDYDQGHDAGKGWASILAMSPGVCLALFKALVRAPEASRFVWRRGVRVFTRALYRLRVSYFGARVRRSTKEDIRSQFRVGASSEERPSGLTGAVVGHKMQHMPALPLLLRTVRRLGLARQVKGSERSLGLGVRVGSVRLLVEELQ